MGKDLTLEVSESPPENASVSSPVIVQQANPEQVIQAAIQTGEASQQAKEAATEATLARKEVKELLEQFRTEFRNNLQPLQEKLAALEERIIPEDEEDTQETANVSVVEIGEPESLTPPIVQQELPPEPVKNPSLFRRIFLNP